MPREGSGACPRFLPRNCPGPAAEAGAVPARQAVSAPAGPRPLRAAWVGGPGQLARSGRALRPRPPVASRGRGGRPEEVVEREPERSAAGRGTLGRAADPSRSVGGNGLPEQRGTKRREAQSSPLPIPAPTGVDVLWVGGGGAWAR